MAINGTQAAGKTMSPFLKQLVQRKLAVMPDTPKKQMLQHLLDGGTPGTLGFSEADFARLMSVKNDVDAGSRAQIAHEASKSNAAEILDLKAEVAELRSQLAMHGEALGRLPSGVDQMLKEHTDALHLRIIASVRELIGG